MSATTDIFEVMDTCRAMRRLKPDPVDRDLLRKLVHAATRAPSAGNTQLWGFLIVDEPEGKQFLGDLMREQFGARFQVPEGNDPSTRMMRAVADLVNGFDQVPAIIFPCVENGYPPGGEPNPLFMWSTIYPATQNLLLAARALGLGAAMTTFQMANEGAIKERFGVPANVSIGATIPSATRRAASGRSRASPSRKSSTGTAGRASEPQPPSRGGSSTGTPTQAPMFSPVRPPGPSRSRSSASPAICSGRSHVSTRYGNGRPCQ